MRRRTTWLVLLACAVPRLLAPILFADRPRTFYLDLAENVAGGRGYTLDGAPATNVEPLYPVLLAIGRRAGGVPGMLVLQIAVACAGALALFAVARRRGGERVAWMAVLLYAVSPYLVRQAASFVEITVATAMTAAAVWALDRALGESRAIGGAIVAGTVLGALVLTRMSFVPIAAGAVAIAAWRGGSALAAGMAAAALLTVAPWLAFSWTRTGTALPPRIGENLFISTTAWAEGLVPAVNLDVLGPVAGDVVQRELGPDASTADGDRLLLRRALAFAAAHPVRTVVLKATNLGAICLPRLLPFTEMRGRAEIVDGALRVPPQRRRPLLFELAAGGFQALLLAGGAAGIWKRRALLAAEDAPLVLVALSIAAVNVVFFPTSRLLAPMTVVPMFYTAVSGGSRGR